MIPENFELKALPSLLWMPSRIPVRDALEANVPKGSSIGEENIPQAYETRWYPESDGGMRLLVPYSGGEYDSSRFKVVPGAWNHVTCDYCNKRIAAMTLCYVTATESDPYICLCAECFDQLVIRQTKPLSRMLRRLKKALRTKTL